MSTRTCGMIIDSLAYPNQLARSSSSVTDILVLWSPMAVMTWIVSIMHVWSVWVRVMKALSVRVGTGMRVGVGMFVFSRHVCAC